MRLADLLEKYKIKGTFFIPARNIGKELSQTDLILLSETHEVGSHSVTHLHLTELNEVDLLREIFLSKASIEKCIGKKVGSFAYPKGLFDDRVIEIVKRSGYACARTTHLFDIGTYSDPFRIGTTLEAKKLPLRITVQFIQRFYPIMSRYFSVPNTYLSLVRRDWVVLAKQLFDLVHYRGGIFHLCGHSWVVDRNDDWGKLEDLMAYISNHNDVSYFSLGELVSYLNQGKRDVTPFELESLQ